MAEPTKTNLNFKTAKVTITEGGYYQLVDTEPNLCSTSYIFIDGASLEGDVFLYLPYSKTTYNDGVSGSIYFILNGSTGAYKISINNATVVKPNPEDLINGVDVLNFNGSPNQTIEAALFAPYRWKASSF
jgi:hypothetical protein